MQTEAVWLGRRLLLWWVAAFGFMPVLAVCPFCGRPGCPSGAGLYATVIAPILASRSRRARRNQKPRGAKVADKRAGADPNETAKRYLESCRKGFWQEVFQLELKYLVEHLAGCRDILSVGCGPAIIESELAKRGFSVTGLDVSREALDYAPNQVRTVADRAEDMPFPKSSFDAVICVVSLQFVKDYRQVLEKSASVLRPGGRIIVMLLNPESVFFKERLRNSDSYVRRIRHADTRDIERALAVSFQVQAEYLMGVEQGRLFESRDPHRAALYILRGTKLPVGAEEEKS